MRSSVYLVGLVTVLVVLVLMTGCPKPPPETGPTPTGPAKTPTTEAPKPSPEASAPVPAPHGDDVASIMALRGNLTSYVMIMNHGGKTTSQAVKLSGGKPVRMKIGAGPGGSWVLVQMDEKVTYMYDGKKKVAIKMPMKAEADPEEIARALGKAPGASAAPDLSGLEGQKPKISSATLAGTDCWLLELQNPGTPGTSVWVDKQYGLVRQSKTGATILKFAYDKINSVPDSEFELPAGTKVMSLPGGMAGKP